MKQIAKLKDEARKHEQREEWNEAIQAYSEVLRLGETGDGAELDLPLYNRVGDLYVRLGRAAEAVKYYEQAADKYAEAGLYNNAIALCNKALRYDAGRVELLKKLGQFSASQGFFTDARRWYLEYCERMSKRGAMDEAFRALSELADVHDDPEIRELLARQLKDHGRPEQAMREYQRAYALLMMNGRTAEADAIRAEIHAIDPHADLASAEMHTVQGQQARRHEELPGFLDEPPVRAPAAAAPPAAPTPAAPAAAPAPVEPAAPAELAFDGPVEEPPLDFGSFEIESSAIQFEEEPAAADYGTIDLESPLTSASGFDLLPLDIGIEPSLEFTPPAEETAEETVVESSDDSAAAVEEEKDVFALSSFDLEEELEAPDATVADEFEESEAVEPLPLIEDNYTQELVESEPPTDETGTPLPLSFDYAEEPETEVEPVAFEPGRAEVPPPMFEFEVPAIEPEPESEAEAFAEPEPEPEVEPEPPATPPAFAAPPPPPVQPPVVPLPPAETPTPRRPTHQYVDLASFLADDEAPVESTRFVVAEHAPTGDEERDFADMLKQFKAKVAETIPKEDAGSHYDLGLAFKEMGLIDEAIAEFQTALRGGEEKLKVYEELGNCFVQKQQYSVAVTILNRAMQMPHSDESELLGVYYNLGRAHEELSQNAEARFAYERIISVDIGFMDTSERLAKL